MKTQLFIKTKGFTLVELLVVISIIGFIAVFSVAVFNSVRMNARDAVRVANIATIQRALAMYLNDSTIGYPGSAGECLDASTGSGKKLVDDQVLLTMPTDPLWPAVAPNPNVADDPDGFCYWYVSTNQNSYQLSYFLESSSKSGSAGDHTATE